MEETYHADGLHDVSLISGRRSAEVAGGRTRLLYFYGKGATGKAPSSIYWGGSNTMLFAGIQDEQLSGFRDRSYNLHHKLHGESKVPLPFHVFILPCIQWF